MSLRERWDADDEMDWGRVVKKGTPEHDALMKRLAEKKAREEEERKKQQQQRKAPEKE